MLATEYGLDGVHWSHSLDTCNQPVVSYNDTPTLTYPNHTYITIFHLAPPEPHLCTHSALLQAKGWDGGTYTLRIFQNREKTRELCSRLLVLSYSQWGHKKCPKQPKYNQYCQSTDWQNRSFGDGAPSTSWTPSQSQNWQFYQSLTFQYSVKLSTLITL